MRLGLSYFSLQIKLVIMKIEIGDWGLGLGIWIGDWDWGLGWRIGIEDWDWRLVVTFGCDFWF